MADGGVIRPQDLPPYLLARPRLGGRAPGLLTIEAGAASLPRLDLGDGF